MTLPDRRSPGALAQHVLTILRADGGWMTVRDVHSIVQQEGSIAYTTALTVMQRLVQQGHLEHHRVGRSGQYRISQVADPSGARSIIDIALARFGTMAITQFVDRTREDPALLAELRRQLEVDDGRA